MSDTHGRSSGKVSRLRRNPDDQRMAQLLDTQAQQVVEVPDEQVTQAVASGRYTLPKGEVAVLDGSNMPGFVPAEQAAEAFKMGFRYRPAAEVEAERQRELYGDRPVAAGIAAAARTATLGASDVIATATGLSTPEELRGLEAQNEELNIVGEIGGAILPTVLTGGAALPAGAVARGASGVAARLTEKAVAREVLAGGIESGLQGLGQAVSEATLEKQPLTAQKVVAAIGVNALLGAGIGGAFGAAHSVLGRGGAREAAEEAVEGAAERAAAPAGSGGLEGIADSAGRIAKPVKEAVEKNPGALKRMFEAMDLEFPDADNLVLKGLDARKGQRAKLEARGLLKEAPAALRADPRFAKVRNLEDASGLISTKLDEAGTAYKESLAALDAARTAEEGVDLFEVASRIEKEVLEPLRKGPAAAQSTANSVEAEIQDLLQKSQGGRVSLAQAEEIKRSFDPFAKFNSASTPAEVSKAQAFRDIREQIKKAVEEQADAITARAGGDGSAAWKAAKHEYSKMAALSEIAEDRLAAKGANRVFSLTDNIGGFAAGALGGGLTPPGVAMGLGVALLNKWGRENLPFILARGMAKYDGSPVVRKAAQALKQKIESAAGAATASAERATSGAAGASTASSELVSALRRVAVVGARELWAVHEAGSADPSYRQAAEAGGLARYSAEADMEGERRGHTLSRLDEAAQRYETRADSAVAGLLAGTRPGLRPLTRETALKQAEEAIALAREPEALVGRIADNLANVGVDAPGITADLQQTAQKAAAFLAQKAPRPPKGPLGDIPALKQAWKPTDTEVERWSAYLQAVEDPASVLEEAAGGRMVPEHVEALSAVYPELLQDVRGRVVDALARHTGSVSYGQRVALSQVLGMPLDDSLQPSTVAALQALHQQQPAKPQGKPSGSSAKTAARLRGELSPADSLSSSRSA